MEMKLFWALLFVLVAYSQQRLTLSKLIALNSDPNGGSTNQTSFTGQQFADTYTIDWVQHSDGIPVSFYDGEGIRTVPLYSAPNNSAILQWSFVVNVTSIPSLIPAGDYADAKSNLAGNCTVNNSDPSRQNAFTTITIALQYCGMINATQDNSTLVSRNVSVIVAFNWNVTHTNGTYTAGTYSMPMNITIKTKAIAFNKFIERTDAVVNNDLQNYEPPAPTLRIQVDVPLQTESPTFNNVGDITGIQLDYVNNVVTKQTQDTYMTFTDQYTNLTSLIIKNAIFDITVTDYETEAAFLYLSEQSWAHCNMVLDNIELTASSNIKTPRFYSLFTPSELLWNSITVKDSTFVTDVKIGTLYSGWDTSGHSEIVRNHFVNTLTQISLDSSSLVFEDNIFSNVSTPNSELLYFDQVATLGGPYVVRRNEVKTSIAPPLVCYYFNYPVDMSSPYVITNNTCNQLSTSYLAPNYGIIYRTTGTCQRSTTHSLWLDNNNTAIVTRNFNTMCRDLVGNYDGCPKFCSPFSTKPTVCYVDAAMPTSDDRYGWDSFPTLSDVASYCAQIYLKNDDSVLADIAFTQNSLNISSLGGQKSLLIDAYMTFNGTRIIFTGINFVSDDPETSIAVPVTFTNYLAQLEFNLCEFTNITSGFAEVDMKCDGVNSTCRFVVDSSIIRVSNGTLFELIDRSTNSALSVIVNNCTLISVSGTILETSFTPNIQITDNTCEEFCVCDDTAGCVEDSLFLLRFRSSPSQSIQIVGNSFANGNPTDYTKFSTYTALSIMGPLDSTAVTAIYDNICSGFPVCMRVVAFDTPSWLSNTKPSGRVQTLDSNSTINALMREWLFYNTGIEGEFVDIFNVDTTTQKFKLDDPLAQCTSFCLSSSSMSGDIYCLVSNYTHTDEPFTYPNVQAAVTSCPLYRSNVINIRVDTNESIHAVIVTSNPRSIGGLSLSSYREYETLRLELNEKFTKILIDSVTVTNGIPADVFIKTFIFENVVLVGDSSINTPLLFDAKNMTLRGELVINSGQGDINIANSVIDGGVSVATSNRISITDNVFTCEGLCSFLSGGGGDLNNNRFIVLNNDASAMPRPGVSVYGTTSSSAFGISGNVASGSTRVGILVTLLLSSYTSSNATGYASSVSNSNTFDARVFDVLFVYNGGSVGCNGNCDGASLKYFVDNSALIIAIIVIAFIVLGVIVVRYNLLLKMSGSKDYANKLKIAADFRLTENVRNLDREVSILRKRTK